MALLVYKMNFREKDDCNTHGGNVARTHDYQYSMPKRRFKKNNKGSHIIKRTKVFVCPRCQGIHASHAHLRRLTARPTKFINILLVGPSCRTALLSLKPFSLYRERVSVGMSLLKKQRRWSLFKLLMSMAIEYHNVIGQEKNVAFFSILKQKKIWLIITLHRHFFFFLFFFMKKHIIWWKL